MNWQQPGFTGQHLHAHLQLLIKSGGGDLTVCEINITECRHPYQPSHINPGE